MMTKGDLKLACLDLALKDRMACGDAVLRLAKEMYEWVLADGPLTDLQALEGMSTVRHPQFLDEVLKRERPELAEELGLTR